jgi:hypothetical protein
MTPFKIPKSAYPAIQSLIHLSDADFERLLNGLRGAKPAIQTEKFWAHVVPLVAGVSENVVRSILHEVFLMAEAQSDEPLAEFAEAITEAGVEAKSEKFPFEDRDRAVLKERLVTILGAGGGFEITRKAAGVLLDQDHIFFSARILTDLRPVFNEAGNSVDAAVIVHNLRIHYGENGDHKDFYVALDTSEIQSLREVLDRADKKAKSLQELIKGSGVSELEEE